MQFGILVGHNSRLLGFCALLGTRQLQLGHISGTLASLCQKGRDKFVPQCQLQSDPQDLNSTAIGTLARIIVRVAVVCLPASLLALRRS